MGQTVGTCGLILQKEIICIYNVYKPYICNCTQYIYIGELDQIYVYIYGNSVSISPGQVAQAQAGEWENGGYYKKTWSMEFQLTKVRYELDYCLELYILH